jgi:hypothetical protein
MYINLRMILIIGFSVLMLSSCVKNPVPKGSINLKNQLDEDFNLIYKLSKKCFEKNRSFFSDAVLVKAEKSDYFTQITFHRTAFDIGISKPFIILDFVDKQIHITEGSYECSHNGCVEFDIKSEIKNWLSGNTNCQYKKY